MKYGECPPGESYAWEQALCDESQTNSSTPSTFDSFTVFELFHEQRAKTPERLWSGFFRVPTEGVPTSTFGVRRSYNFADPVDFHTGLDHAGARGQGILCLGGEPLWSQ